jgi:hypothetical protein
MSTLNPKHRIVKPALCDSRLYRNPIAPCEILPSGLSGSLEINGTFYEVEILGYLLEVGEPFVDGYRLTKDDGTGHDICLVAGRMECTCGDWLRRRAALADPTVADCKHILACKQHFYPPVDQQSTRVPVLSAAVHAQEQAPERPSKQPVPQYCSEPGCSRPAVNCGLCEIHEWL